jgi:hypothetical protein
MNAGASWLPMGAVTGIGSLPCTDAWEALQLIAEWCPEIPFWPQLPCRAAQEGMVEQALGSGAACFLPCQQDYGYDLRHGFQQVCWHHFRCGESELTPQTAAGFFAFEQGLASGMFARARALKGQGVGPITLACQLFSDGRPFLFEPEALSALSEYVMRQALWQVGRLQRWKLPLLYFIDEPCLALLETEPYVSVQEQALQALGHVVKALQAQGVLVGLHCCAEQRSFSLLCQAAPDILSFDAYHGLEMFAVDPAARAFLKGGGFVAFGLVPTTDPSALDAPTLFTRWLLSSPMQEDKALQLAAQSMITATCGLGLLPPAHAWQALRTTTQIAAMVRKVALSHHL